MSKATVIILPLLVLTLSFSAGARSVSDISRGWTFTREGTGTLVDIPHTWNAQDTFDEQKGYWRGACEYSKTITCSRDDGRTFLRVGAANQKSEVFVGGRSVGTHIGGYTAFCYEITDFLHEGDNEIVIRVDNSFDEQVAPLFSDFTFYGGISRRVELIRTGKDCISPLDFASDGVYVTPKVLRNGSAQVEVRTVVDGRSGSPLRLDHKIVAPSGETLAKARVKVSSGGAVCSLKVLRPELWSPGTPSLYTLETVLRGRGGRELDRMSTVFGIRSCRFDPVEGLFLNGIPVKIMGASRHQDYEGIGNALPDSIHIADVVLLKRMGGNFMRTAHYPQAPAVMRACDSLGIMTSVEIPIVDHATISEEFTANQLSQLREMIHQNYNSPSVLLWGYMNEAILHISFRMKPTEEERLSYYAGLRRLAQTLNDEAKRLDPSRGTMVVFADDLKRYSETGIPEIPDVQGWNLYRGWYGRSITEFGPALDEIHARYPDKPMMVTEYGAGIDQRLHSDAPERFDFSPEYGLEFHRGYASDILSRPFVAGGVVWALADFYSEARIDATPHINNKGITSLSRFEKDVYMYYRALLSREPYLSIGGKDWPSRSGNAGSVRPVPVFTNASEVSLSLNGKSLGTRKAEGRVAFFPVALEDGENVLTASSGEVSDTLRVSYSAVDMKNFASLRVMLGGSRHYSSNGLCWLPEQPYTEGSWGYVGGKPGRPTAAGREIPCSNSDILGTTDDPLYQSQRVGLEAFKADVPAGRYKVVLHFAELASGWKTSVLAYNLGNDIDYQKATERVFDVSVNGEKVLDRFNIRKEYGPLRAVTKCFEVSTDGGLDISFTPLAGSAVLNAIEIIHI